MIPYLDLGTAKWNAATGGTAISDNVTFAEKQIKQAGIIATQDSSWDMMYSTRPTGTCSSSAHACWSRSDPWFGDTARLRSRRHEVA